MQSQATVTLLPCRDVNEDHVEQPSMRWVSTAAQSECQSQETGGRTVLRANPEGAMGFSYSVTDTSVPSADGSRRCALPSYLDVIVFARSGKNICLHAFFLSWDQAGNLRKK